ncbi:hypothetical protein C8R44DRAFT_247973 [Mycena epipterygia]|nr:hypothetical protein C8R44DRAFT_247973 [Mycena epipterygia]
MLIRRGLKSQVNKALLIITLSMYILSAAYWAYCFVEVVIRIQINSQNATSTPITKWLLLFNALILVNYVLSDGVVIWRAGLICSPDHRKYLHFPLFCLIITSISVIGTIGLRIVSVTGLAFSHSSSFRTTINTLQMSNVSLSFISNLSATVVVGVTAWRHRQTIRAGFDKTTKGNQILCLLLESGILYCVSGLIVLVAPLIRLRYSMTLGDIYTPVNTQIAGAYTPIVLLLVSMQRSLSEPSFLGTIPDSCGPPPFQLQLSDTCPKLPTPTSMHFSAQFGELIAEVDSDTKGNANGKGHRYQVSDTTLV